MGDVVDHAIAYLDKATMQLSEAYFNGDWERVRQLDEDLRMGFVDLTPRLKNNTAPQLLQRLEQLIALYRQVIAGCEDHRREIRDQMLEVSKSQRMCRTYTSVSNFALSDLRSQPWQRR